MADYSSSIWTPPVRGTNMSDSVTQTDILDAQNAEIVAMQTVMGVSPLDSYSNMRARFRGMGTTRSFRYVPSGNEDGGGATWTTWVTLVNMTVPSWCTEVIATVHISNWLVTQVTNPLVFNARFAVGGTAGNQSGTYTHQQASTTFRYPQWSFTDTVTSPPTGVQALAVQVFRATGASGTVRADTGTVLSGTVVFKG